MFKPGQKIGKMSLPKKEDFPKGTKFYIKEFNVPLAQVPDGKLCKWFNWLVGKPKEYDVTCLKPGNNWESESFEEWQNIIKDSL